jgi:hypothetical protein
MPTVLVFHEVEDVDHWLRSPKRDEILGSAGISARTFRDPLGSNRVGLIMEVPDAAAIKAILQAEETVAAMEYDGVRPTTLVVLEES